MTLTSSSIILNNTKPECLGLMDKYYSMACDSVCPFAEMCAEITIKERFNNVQEPKKKNPKKPKNSS